jgi:hypothetical protein
MIGIDKLAEGFVLNRRLIQMHTEGLTHADSLVQTPFNINSLNWVLGHIAVNQDRVLVLAGQEPLLDKFQTARYESGSEPVRQDGEGVMDLDDLLDVLSRGQAQIIEILPLMTPEELAREIKIGEHSTTVGDRLFGLYFHDTYHTGQTDLLRQVAGKNDKIV